jgi:hypothetical protein
MTICDLRGSVKDFIDVLQMSLNLIQCTFTLEGEDLFGNLVTAGDVGIMRHEQLKRLSLERPMWETDRIWDLGTEVFHHLTLPALCDLVVRLPVWQGSLVSFLYQSVCPLLQLEVKSSSGKTLVDCLEHVPSIVNLHLEWDGHGNMSNDLLQMLTFRAPIHPNSGTCVAPNLLHF